MAQILLVNLTFIEKFIMLNGEVENENRSAEEFFYMFVDISFFLCVRCSSRYLSFWLSTKFLSFNFSWLGLFRSVKLVSQPKRNVFLSTSLLLIHVAL
jgi:hypothetical protein